MSALNDVPPVTGDFSQTSLPEGGDRSPASPSPPARSNRLKRLVAEPLVHFVLIGAVIFGLHAYIDRIVNPDNSSIIRVSPQLVKQGYQGCDPYNP